MRKSQSWKLCLANSVLAVHTKLAAYYNNTDGPQGKIYNWATILDPPQRLETYKSLNYDRKLLKAYESDFGSEYTKRYAALKREATPERKPQTTSARMSFSALAAHKQHAMRAPPTRTARPIEYLSAPVSSDADVLAYWMAHELKLPGLSQMAKDILAVPISGVGVERLFSTALQMCCFTRNRLRPSTIQKMMVVKHAEGYISRKKKKEDVQAVFEREDDGGTDQEDDVEGDYAVAERQAISDDEEGHEESEENEVVL